MVRSVCPICTSMRKTRSAASTRLHFSPDSLDDVNGRLPGRLGNVGCCVMQPPISCSWAELCGRILDVFYISFLPRDALEYKARYWDCMTSVRLSVCLSVTLVDHAGPHIGWKSWKLIARTLSLTPSLFVAQRPSIYSQGNMGKFGGD